MKTATHTAGIRSLVYRHLRAAASALPLGTREAPVRGRAVAEAALRGSEVAYDRRVSDPEGTAHEVITALWDAGALPLHRCPSAAVCDQAMRLLLRVSPLFVRVRAGLYRLVLAAYRADQVHEDRAAELRGLQTAEDVRAARLGPARAGCPRRGSREADPAAGSDPSAPGARAAEGTALHLADPPDPGPTLVHEAEEPSHACGRAAGLGGDSSHYRAPAGGRSEDTGPAALAGSAAAAAFARGDRPKPADQGGQAASASPSGGRLRRFTPSGWLQAVPKGKHVARVASLVARHLPAEGLPGSAREVVERLARMDGQRLTRRGGYGLARALGSLLRRGLVLFEHGVWRLPERVEHDALAVFGVAEMPGCRRPGAELAGHLERLGVDPRGLSHDEAVALSRRFWTRREAGLASPGAVLRIAREQQLADLPVDLRRLRRLDWAEARRELESAMAERRWQDAQRELDRFE